MNRLLFIALLIIPNHFSAQGKFEFVNEKIDFSISSSCFAINGIYVFANNTEKEIYQTILFPFSNESDSITVNRVFNLSYAQNLPYKRVENGITFNILLLPKDTVNVNISYNQKTERENVYILKSTRTWNKPLKSASYSLASDNSVKIERLSLNPDTLIHNVYYWNKTDFYPDENFKIWIKLTDSNN